MSDIQTLQSKITELQAELDKLKAEQDWPKIGDEVFYEKLTGEISSEYFDPKWTSIHKLSKTEAEAIRERDRRQLVHELRKEANFYKPVWNTRTENWFLVFNVSGGGWVWSSMLNDFCPASGYFAQKDETLIARYGDRLNLLRDGG